MSTAYSFSGFSGNYQIDDLLEGERWGLGHGATVTLTYSFPNSAGNYVPGYGAGEPLTGFAVLTSAQQSAVASALAAWAAVANVQFIRVDDSTVSGGDIRVAWTRVSDIQNSQAYAYSPGSGTESGDIWLNPDANWAFTPGSYGFMSLVHESGHALGLSHPFDGGLGGTLPTAEDGLANTLMSYTKLAGNTSAVRVNFYPTTPMAYDIAAMQFLYGANTSYHAGDDTYTFTQGSSYFQTIWDNGGNDTIVWSTPASTNLVTTKPESASIDLRPGHWSDLGNSLTFTSSQGAVVATSANTVEIYTGVVIENATGGGAADTLIGNDAANRLSGGAGDDMLTGGAGNDTLLGGTDYDTAVYAGAHASYTLAHSGAMLTVTDKSGAEGTDSLTDVERLKFSDGSFAVDMGLDQAGGKTALLIGAFFGHAGFADTKEVGILLSYFSLDQLRVVNGLPTYSPHTLADGAAFLMDFQDLPAAPGSTSNRTFVSLVFKNIVGVAADDATVTVFADILDSHALTQAQLLSVAAALPLNQTQVDLVGLAASGMLFAPYV